MKILPIYKPLQRSYEPQEIAVAFVCVVVLVAQLMASCDPVVVGTML